MILNRGENNVRGSQEGAVPSDPVSVRCLKISTMKIWHVVGLAVLVGAGVGIGAGFVRTAWYPWDGTPSGAGGGAASPKEMGPPMPSAKVLVEADTFDFGVMDNSATRRHEFVFKNVGTMPLALSQGPTSCKCTASILEEGEIPPGRSSTVVVEWTGGDTVGEFTQTARILTNDPSRAMVTLKIKGRVTQAARVTPSELVLTDITVGETESGQVKLFGFRSKPLEITGYEFSRPSTAAHFEVTFQPMTADQVAAEAEKDATSGCLVEITVKPGLPQWGIQQRIVFTTNYEEAPTIEVPVRVTTGSEISIVAAGWNKEAGVLDWGTLRSKEGARRKLILRVAGLHHREVTFKPIEVFPDLLKVDVGKTSDLENGAVSVTPLIIQVPKGSRPADHLGLKEENLGRIILETTHPDVRELRIRVRFAVAG